MISYTGHFEITISGKYACQEVLSYADRRYTELEAQVIQAKRNIKNKPKYCARQQKIIDIASELTKAKDLKVFTELVEKNSTRFRQLGWRYQSYTRRNRGMTAAKSKNAEDLERERKEILNYLTYDVTTAKEKIKTYTLRAEQSRIELPKLEALLGEFRHGKDLNDMLFKEE